MKKPHTQHRRYASTVQPQYGAHAKSTICFASIRGGVDSDFTSEEEENAGGETISINQSYVNHSMVKDRNSELNAKSASYVSRRTDKQSSAGSHLSELLRKKNEIDRMQKQPGTHLEALLRRKNEIEKSRSTSSHDYTMISSFHEKSRVDVASQQQNWKNQISIAQPVSQVHVSSVASSGVTSHGGESLVDSEAKQVVSSSNQFSGGSVLDI